MHRFFRSRLRDHRKRRCRPCHFLMCNGKKFSTKQTCLNRTLNRWTFERTLARYRCIKSIKPARIAAEDSFFIRLRQVAARQQFVDLPAAFLGVEDFVGKIAAEYKRLAPRFLNREAEAGIIDVEADVHSPFANLPPEI